MRVARGLLAVIEMQRVLADPGSPWATSRCAGAAAGVARLLPDFGDRVVLTRFLARLAFPWRACHEQWPLARRPRTSTCGG
ncbi:hypothetical protein [Streptomyces sp. BV129]|uniref:hypothetical protein n=1 Tax=Streptomyces sp. BV129 TaxID=2849671 RepID=UPI001C2EB4D8|nr:hypothetical protein [Streptomyces sp. BV129]MBV1949002.1 hypothetical protein [Streptomyces sp. BV129]